MLLCRRRAHRHTCTCAEAQRRCKCAPRWPDLLPAGRPPGRCQRHGQQRRRATQQACCTSLGVRRASARGRHPPRGALQDNEKMLQSGCTFTTRDSTTTRWHASSSLTPSCRSRAIPRRHPRTFGHECTNYGAWHSCIRGRRFVDGWSFYGLACSRRVPAPVLSAIQPVADPKRTCHQRSPSAVTGPAMTSPRSPDRTPATTSSSGLST